MLLTTSKIVFQLWVLYCCFVQCGLYSPVSTFLSYSHFPYFLAVAEHNLMLLILISI